MSDLNNLLSTLESLSKPKQNTEQTSQNNPLPQPQSSNQQPAGDSLSGLLSSLQNLVNSGSAQQTSGQPLQQISQPSQPQPSSSQASASDSLASLLSSLNQGLSSQPSNTNTSSSSPSQPQAAQPSTSPINSLLSNAQPQTPPKSQQEPAQNPSVQPQPSTEPQSLKFEPISIEIPSFKEITVQLDSTVRISPGESIQTAINSAIPNTIIEIPAGVYNEELTIVKPISLRSVGGKVEIHGKGESDVIIIQSSYCELNNLDIFQGNNKSGNAVTISDGFTKLTNCRIQSELLSSVQVDGQSQVLIEHCSLSGPQNPILLVTDNAIVNVKTTDLSNTKTHGICIEKYASLIVEDCKFTDIDNTAIAISDHARVFAKGSHFSQIRHIAIDNLSTSQVIVDGCSFDNITTCGVNVCGQGHSALVRSSKFTTCNLAGIKATSNGTIRSLDNHFVDIGSNVMILADNAGLIQAEKNKFEGTSLSSIGAFSNGQIQCRDLSFINITGHAFLSYDKGKIEAESCLIDTQSGQPAVHVRDFSEIKFRQVIINGGQSTGIFISDHSTGEIVDTKVQNTATIGIELARLNSFRVSNCDFSNNKVAGISVHDTMSAIFENCEICNNGNIGCDVSSSNTSPQFINCHFNNNKEAGCMCQDGPTPQFIRCTFDSSPKIGFCVKAAKPRLENCAFRHNGSAGISVYSGSNAVFTKCEFDSNANFAGQIFGNSSYCKLADCKVSNHSQSVAFYISDKAKLRCVNTSLVNSGQLHFSVQNATLSCRNCDMGESKGTGIQLVSSTLKMKQTTIHECQKVAMIVGNQGNVKILDNSSIKNNKQAGIICFSDSNVMVKESTIDSNGGIGIQAPEQCELTVEKCTISNHVQYGIIIGKNTKLNDLGNSFNNNGRKDIEIMQK